jgi:hypothetical protein
MELLYPLDRVNAAAGVSVAERSKVVLGSASEDLDGAQLLRVAARQRRRSSAQESLGIRRHDDVDFEEASLGQAKGMPPLVFINVPECDANGAMASAVRRAAIRHGLRGASTGVAGTLAAMRAQPAGPPAGPPAVIADGISMHDLQSLQLGGQLAEFPYTFTMLDHPLDRAVASFVHHGVARSGWAPSRENLEAFLLGTGAAAAALGAVEGFHTSNFITRHVASQDEILRVTAAERLGEDDVAHILDRYNLVGIRRQLNESLVLLQMSVPTLELQDVLQVPHAGYSASDPFGFATAELLGREAALSLDARAWMASAVFQDLFRQANAADYALYDAAQRRLDDRVRNAGPTYARRLSWMRELNGWLETRLAAQPAFGVAVKMPRATATVAACPEGEEARCARGVLLAGAGNGALAEQARLHAGEECLFLNQGCFTQLVVDVMLAEVSRSAVRRIEGVTPVSAHAVLVRTFYEGGAAGGLGGLGGVGVGGGDGGGPGSAGAAAQDQAVRIMRGELEEEPPGGDGGPLKAGDPLHELVMSMRACATMAEVKGFKTCKDDATFGRGLVGKRIVAATQQVYILCHREECGAVCVPEMWAHITTVLDGAKTDECLGFDRPEGRYVDHWHKASLLHAAAIEHARTAGYAPISIVESDAVFIEGDLYPAAAPSGSATVDSAAGTGAPWGTMRDDGGDGMDGENEIAGLQAMLGGARWAAADEKAMLELVASGAADAGSSSSSEAEPTPAPNATAATGAGVAAVADRWTIIRLGYRALDFESGVQSCPSRCGCWYEAGVARWCTVRAYSCDMRAAHAYIVSAHAFPLILQELLGTPGYGVIDAGTMQRIPHQVFMTPMLAVQIHAQADLITPAQQLGHGNAFAHACATGRVGVSAAAAAAEEQALLTQHAHHELAQYLPQGSAA